MVQCKRASGALGIKKRWKYSMNKLKIILIFVVCIRRDSESVISIRLPISDIRCADSASDGQNLGLPFENCHPLKTYPSSTSRPDETDAAHYRTYGVFSRGDRCYARDYIETERTNRCLNFHELTHSTRSCSRKPRCVHYRTYFDSFW